MNNILSSELTEQAQCQCPPGPATLMSIFRNNTHTCQEAFLKEMSLTMAERWQGQAADCLSPLWVYYEQCLYRTESTDGQYGQSSC